MRKNIVTACFFGLLSMNALSQEFKGQFNSTNAGNPWQHFVEEYTFDRTINKDAWRLQKSGLHASFASTDELFFRTEVPELQKETMSWTATGWKGERLNAQILVWSPDTIKQVRFRVSDLKSSSGKIISKENVEISLVRYVVSNFPYGVKNVTCGPSEYKNLYMMPDKFENFDRFDIPEKTTRPVWLSLNVPQQAEAGTYKGTVEVKSEQATQILPIEITIQNMSLPPPNEWKHRLDLWQNPWVVAVRNNLKPWSVEHVVLLKKHLQLYADAGGTFITTYGVHSPWADVSYTPEGGMIDWIKKKDGSWAFDYTIFDKYVELAMSLGIDRAITIYSPVPWGFRFKYTDEVSGNYIYESWAPTTEVFKNSWNIFLTDLKKHLELKGWFNKTYLGINENTMEETLAAIKVIKEHSSLWKITYAGNWHKELDDLLDDYSFLYGNESDSNVVKNRMSKGFTTTYYVCCNPPFPNNFVFSPPIEGRWISWYSAAKGYSGFLRWAYDAWPADVTRDARHTHWAAGDCFLVYPGGSNCIRLVKLREGIVDFEKIRILREKVSRSTDRRVKKLANDLEKHLQVFLQEKKFDTQKITNDVLKGRQFIEQLSALLATP